MGLESKRILDLGHKEEKSHSKKRQTGPSRLISERKRELMNKDRAESEEIIGLTRC